MQLQYNAVTSKPYEGRNQAELLNAKKARNYKSNEWVTFLQARQLNKKLVGAKGQGVAIFKGFQLVDSVELDKDNRKQIKTASRPMGFAYVFNMDLCQDLTPEELEKLKSKTKKV